MTVISLVSFSGAPGATTTAMATTAALIETSAPEPILLELATSGGVVADQYDLPTEPGLASLTIDLGGDGPDLLDHAQELPGGAVAVVAPHSGSKVTKLLSAKADPLADYLKETAKTVIADCGRISTDSPAIPILSRSSLVPIVIRPSRQDFHLAALTMAEINESLDVPLPAGWVIVGPCPWSHDEIIGQYGLPIFTTMAFDQVGAEAVAGFRKFRRRSPLARTANAFAEDLAKHLRVSDADDPLAYLAAGQSPIDQPTVDQPPDGPQATTATGAEPGVPSAADTAMKLGEGEEPEGQADDTAEETTKAERVQPDENNKLIDSELGASAR